MQTRTGTELPGYDVSAYQRTIDFANYWATDEGKFLIHRAYRASSSNQTGSIDTEFVKNIQNAKQSGVGKPLGGYCFIYPVKNRPDLANAQAQGFAQALHAAFGEGNVGDIIPVVDVEPAYPMNANNLNANEMLDFTTQFIQTFYQLTGSTVMIYTGHHIVESYDNFQKSDGSYPLSSYKLWISIFPQYNPTEYVYYANIYNMNTSTKGPIYFQVTGNFGTDPATGDTRYRTLNNDVYVVPRSSNSGYIRVEPWNNAVYNDYPDDTGLTTPITDTFDIYYYHNWSARLAMTVTVTIGDSVTDEYIPGDGNVPGGSFDPLYPHLDYVVPNVGNWTEWAIWQYSFSGAVVGLITTSHARNNLVADGVSRVFEWAGAAAPLIRSSFNLYEGESTVPLRMTKAQTLALDLDADYQINQDSGSVTFKTPPLAGTVYRYTAQGEAVDLNFVWNIDAIRTPPKVENLRVIEADSQLTLTWTYPTQNYDRAEVLLDGNVIGVVTPLTETSYTIENLQNGRTYVVGIALSYLSDRGGAVTIEGRPRRTPIPPSGDRRYLEIEVVDPETQLGSGIVYNTTELEIFIRDVIVPSIEDELDSAVIQGRPGIFPLSTRATRPHLQFNVDWKNYAGIPFNQGVNTLFKIFRGEKMVFVKDSDNPNRRWRGYFRGFTPEEIVDREMLRENIQFELVDPFAQDVETTEQSFNLLPTDTPQTALVTVEGDQPVTPTDFNSQFRIIIDLTEFGNAYYSIVNVTNGTSFDIYPPVWNYFQSGDQIRIDGVAVHLVRNGVWTNLGHLVSGNFITLEPNMTNRIQYRVPGRGTIKFQFIERYLY